MSSISNNEPLNSSNTSNISAIPDTDQLTHLNDYNLLLNYGSNDSNPEKTIHPAELDTPLSQSKLLALSSKTTITKSSDSDMEISDSNTSPNHLHPKEKPTGSDSTTAMPIGSTDLLGPPFFTGLVPWTLWVPDQESNHTTSRDARLANSNLQRPTGRRPFGGTKKSSIVPAQCLLLQLITTQLIIQFYWKYSYLEIRCLHQSSTNSTLLNRSWHDLMLLSHFPCLIFPSKYENDLQSNGDFWWALITLRF